jgi:hypothetical protein
MQFQCLLSTAVIPLFLSLATATPFNYTDYGIDESLADRPIMYFGGQLPTCKDNDPSYSTGTKFKDNEGKYISWDCNHADGSAGKNQECWQASH